MERKRQQNDSLVDGYARRAAVHGEAIVQRHVVVARVAHPVGLHRRDAVHRLPLGAHVRPARPERAPLVGPKQAFAAVSQADAQRQTHTRRRTITVLYRT